MYRSLLLADGPSLPSASGVTSSDAVRNGRRNGSTP